MSFPKYLSWRSIKSWRCTTCGRCCREYRVILRPYEYTSISRLFGPTAIMIDSLGNPCLNNVGDRCIFQDFSGSCALQPLGIKPLACKLWPLSVYGSETRMRRRGEAVFHHRGEEYYIYANPACTGINKGKPEELPLTLHEIVEISNIPSRHRNTPHQNASHQLTD